MDPLAKINSSKPTIKASPGKRGMGAEKKAGRLAHRMKNRKKHSNMAPAMTTKRALLFCECQTGMDVPISRANAENDAFQAGSASWGLLVTYSMPPAAKAAIGPMKTAKMAKIPQDMRINYLAQLAARSFPSKAESTNSTNVAEIM